MLLGFTDPSIEAEIMNAWLEDGKDSDDGYISVLVHYDFVGDHNVLVFLDSGQSQSWSLSRFDLVLCGSLWYLTSAAPDSMCSAFGNFRRVPQAQARIRRKNRSLDIRS